MLLRDELVRIQNKYGRLPGNQLGKMMRYPAVYGLDTLSVAVHLQVHTLKKKPETTLSEMEADFLEIFGQSYNF